MKQEATNTFSEGLMMDLNPITTPNNVLTNALNATILTYNGNEFVLQNDMGNGKVETAYLPSGYVPVGIKEYGGIVYIASYNPLTNKSQLGSFPSPERNITSEEAGTATKNIDLKSLFGFNEQSGASRSYSKFPLFGESSDTVIRPGDKFMLRCKTGMAWSDLQKLISNFDNYSQGTPYNRLFKISLNVLDSSGNLKDITAQLKRINSSNKVIDTTDMTTTEKANTGYFMSVENGSGNPTPDDIDDLRNAVEMFNVYNNKLSGELIITVELSTIKAYDIEIYGVRADKEPVEWVPPIKTPSLSPITVSPGNAAIIFKANYQTDSKDDYWGWTEATFTTGTETPVPYYIPDENEFTKVIQLTELTNSDVLHYSLTPVMQYIKLDGLQRVGSIDLSLLGTGKVSLNEWKYYNDLSNNMLTISWGLDAYLKEGDTIEEVKFIFKDLKKKFESPVEYVCAKRRSYNGSFTEIINYETDAGIMLNKQSLFVVEIVYTLKHTVIETQAIQVESLAKRILYTSTVFNKDYSGSERDFSKLLFPEVEINSKVVPTILSRTSPIAKVIDNVNIDFNIPSEPYPFYYNYEERIKTKYRIDAEAALKSNMFPFDLNDYSYIVSKPTTDSLFVEQSDVEYSTTIGASFSYSDIKDKFDLDPTNFSKAPIRNTDPVTSKYSLDLQTETDIHPGITSTVADNNVEIEVRNTTQMRANAQKSTRSENLTTFEPFIYNDKTYPERLLGSQDYSASTSDLVTFSNQNLLVWQSSYSDDKGGKYRRSGVSLQVQNGNKGSAIVAMREDYNGSSKSGHTFESGHNLTAEVVKEVYSDGGPTFIIQAPGTIHIDGHAECTLAYATAEGWLKFADYALLWWKHKSGRYEFINGRSSNIQALLQALVKRYQDYYIAQTRNSSSLNMQVTNKVCYLNKYKINYQQALDVKYTWKDYKYKVILDDDSEVGFTRTLISDMYQSTTGEVATEVEGWDNNIPEFSETEALMTDNISISTEAPSTTVPLEVFSQTTLPNSIVMYKDTVGGVVKTTITNAENLDPSKIYLRSGYTLGQLSMSESKFYILGKARGFNTIVLSDEYLNWGWTDSPQILAGSTRTAFRQAQDRLVGDLIIPGTIPIF